MEQFKAKYLNLSEIEFLTTLVDNNELNLSLTLKLLNILITNQTASPYLATPFTNLIIKLLENHKENV